MDEVIERTSKAKIFSKIDLKSGYHQLLLQNSEKEKTAFNTRYGQFQFKVLPFGLCNAPSKFMKVMNDIFQEYLDKFVIIYLDDILIYSESEQEHDEHLQKVVKKLKQCNLKANPKKCVFFTKSIEFLGHVIENGGVRPDPNKLIAISKFPYPKDITAVRSFLGLTSYYQRFIKDYSVLAAPLYDLLKKDVVFHWRHEHSVAMERLKYCMQTYPVLRFPNYSKPFILQTDASYLGLGGVLQQEFDDGIHPIGFASRSLKDGEKNNPVHQL